MATFLHMPYTANMKYHMYTIRLCKWECWREVLVVCARKVVKDDEAYLSLAAKGLSYWRLAGWLCILLSRFMQLQGALVAEYISRIMLNCLLKTVKPPTSGMSAQCTQCVHKYSFITAVFLLLTLCNKPICHVVYCIFVFVDWVGDIKCSCW